IQDCLSLDPKDQIQHIKWVWYYLKKDKEKIDKEELYQQIGPAYLSKSLIGHLSGTSFQAAELKGIDKIISPEVYKILDKFFLDSSSDQNIENLLYVLFNILGEIVVLKQMLLEQGIWDETIYRKKKIELKFRLNNWQGTPLRHYQRTADIYIYLFDLINQLKIRYDISDEELKEIEKVLEKFKFLT
ncbi:hypothetical protein D6779_10175, partial [Candidatus Parcubacteria bacterium]